MLILLDAGRMMSSTLGRLTKLDHAVNTALMLSYVAIAKGDEVGLLGFADAVRAYDPPRRGHRQFLRLTESLRRLEVTTTEPDYRAAFEFLRSKTARRAPHTAERTGYADDALCACGLLLLAAYRRTTP